MEPASISDYAHRDNSMIATKTHLTLTGLASHLVQDGLLEAHVAAEAQREARRQDIPLVSYLTKHKIISSKNILESCAKTFNLPVIDLDHYDLSKLDTETLSFELMHRYHVIPLKKHLNILQIGLSDPTDHQAIDTVKFYTGLVIQPVIVAEDQLTRFIYTHFNNQLDSKNLTQNLLNEISLEEKIHVVEENAIQYDEPLIRFVDHIIRHALEQSASDIHIEPYESICRIRYRQDGILYETSEIPSHLAIRLVTRLKVMAKLDISERRLPQDGRFQLHHIDIRISTCPTLFGEKVVLRLLDPNKISLDIETLGFSTKQREIFIDKISQSQGMIIVTGPTGSGKTVTLYTALKHLNTPEKNISTVEDPVEIQLKGINQVHINPKINLHFATALRTFLRQDPDVIMVGEIRDTETAEIAIQAAQTGHLVLTTLHTNSAIETLLRLQSMNIASYNIVSATSLIIAQRLVRKLCSHCKQIDTVSYTLLKKIGLSSTKIYRAAGCQQCLNGYHGRIGIYELLPMTEQLAQLILANPNTITLLEHVKRDGFQTLFESGLEQVAKGLTSLTEINRVIQK